MAHEQVILDFAGDSPLHFREPRRVIEARTLDQVRPALLEAKAAADAGAWVACMVSYEAAPAFDTAMRVLPAAGPVPLAWFGVFDGPLAAPAASSPAPALDWTTGTGREDYDSAIDRIREAIATGDVYQVNHTLRFRARAEIDPFALYDALAAPRHGRYHALIRTPEWSVVSASPELFLDIREGRITTRPMKGTIRRGRWLEDDRAAHQRLAASAKDRAENLMIVDLLRNDLGRVARYGSVDVPALFAIETYPTVYQMTSTIAAQLRDDVSLDDVFAATFPCGSITGAPKIAAMQMIAELEQEPRGAYCGAIGIMRPDGSATFNVAIRTVTLDHTAHVAEFGAGGGITWDSIADAEYDEVLAKALLLDEPLPAFDLLETMRLDDGVIRRLHLHLQRLRASAEYFGWPASVGNAAEDALGALCETCPTGSWRVRLTVSRAGECTISHTPLESGDGGVKTVTFASLPVSSSDVLLFHKTTARDVYLAMRAEHPNAFDVLLRNEHGFITEFTNGNVVFEIDGQLVTPARRHGLLAGCFREELLRESTAREDDVRVVDVARAARIWLINSVREWVEVIPQANA